jgi:diadenosine tetraphosphate (Ap4A) HIT family hydrolase
VSENECAFCKLASGEYKSEIVHREEEKMTFHSIRGKSLAHMLVIPRNQVVSPEEIERLPEGAAKCACVCRPA